MTRSRWMETLKSRAPLFQIIRHAVLPALFYFTCFCLLTWPLMSGFLTRFFGGATDGLQNVWNVWWVSQVLRRPDLYPSIWHTSLLHWPTGTSLLGHTLTPFNGYLGAALLSAFSLKTSYNTLVVFAFVMSGLTMHWLAYYLTRSYWPSVLAGFLFTFSNYHLGHGFHQLNSASLEWIPLFLLCWLVLLTRPHPLLGLAAALALWLVLLCDDYYFLYAVLSAVLVFAWYALSVHSLRFLARREHLIPLGLFVGALLLLAGPQLFALLVGNSLDPFIGGHDATSYSLDLLGLLIPGPTWRFSDWTQAYWSRLPGNETENSVFLSLPGFFLIVALWLKRRALEPAVRSQLYLWSAMLGFFFLLGLGPVLHVAGVPVWDKWMPYSLLGAVLPFLSISGVPARMVSMISLAAALLSAFALRGLFEAFPARRLLTLALLAIILFETLPAASPSVSVETPAYITALAALPDDGGVVDLVKTRSGLELFYQTIHHKPISFGYLSRLPSSVVQADERLAAALQAHDYASLWGSYHITYLLTSDPLPPRPDQAFIQVTAVYYHKGIRIYRLSCLCQPAH